MSCVCVCLFVFVYVCMCVHAILGNWGFPKGGGKGKEDILACALREMEEETGVTPSDINLITSERLYYVDEFKVRNGIKALKARYFIAKIKKKSALNTTKQLEVPGAELRSAKWFPIEKALRKLRPSREAVLRQASALYQKYLEGQV